MDQNPNFKTKPTRLRDSNHTPLSFYWWIGLTVNVYGFQWQIKSKVHDKNKCPSEVDIIPSPSRY